MFKTIPFLLVCILMIIPLTTAAQDHGVPVDGYPQWHERGLMVTTNALRMAPTDFRDAYCQYDYILQPENHPPVPPLHYCEALNQAARFHSEDMAENSFLGHESSDGTSVWVRIARWYSYTGYRGENVAGGYDNALATTIQLVEDGGAEDGTPAAGHRTNIMNSNFTEGGAGYGHNPGVYLRHYWTFDFGGRNLGDPAPLVDGTHFFQTDGHITFWANWYQPSASSPQSARVHVDGVSHDLDLHLGSAEAGTYTLAIALASDCRSYNFEFVDAGGNSHWYPETGYLRTFAEGGCEEDYALGTSDVPGLPRGILEFETIAPNPFNPSTNLAFHLEDPSYVRLVLLDAAGRHVRTLLVDNLDEGSHTVEWDGRDATGMRVSAGVYLANLEDGAGRVQTRKLTLVK